MTVKAIMPVGNHLVVPLAHEATAMRTKETARPGEERSCAVPDLIGCGLRRGDVDSTNGRSTRATTATPGTRTSTTATRTTTTRTTSFSPARSADGNDALHAGASFEETVIAYYDCRRSKRNTESALAFEFNLERNLVGLYDELAAGTYRPGPSICFVVTQPKAREVWAADFRDRVVHHLMYNRIGPRFENAFIADSCACIKGRGTLYAALRLESKIRGVTRNWSRPGWYLKCDIANFFVAIDKARLAGLLDRRVPEPWWRWLVEIILFHDPRPDVILRAGEDRMALVAPHKRLGNQPEHLGLPIGNLSSQFFANVYLNELDQFAKHVLRAQHYIRYVDDFLLLHESREWLVAALEEITAFLPRELGVHLNPQKTIIQPIDRGVDFVGQVIKPWYRRMRPRVVRQGIARVAAAEPDDLFTLANSYLGLFRQASSSHTDRARLAKVIRMRGHAVDRKFTKAFQLSSRE